MNEYLLIFPIDEFRTNTLYPAGKKLPLHCTLMHWFQSPLTQRALAAGVQRLLIDSREKGVNLVPDHPALFGPNTDVPVQVLERNERLLLLHTRILIFLAKEGGVFPDDKWMGAGYRPHIADTAERSFASPESHFARNVLIMMRREGGRAVVAATKFNS